MDKEIADAAESNEPLVWFHHKQKGWALGNLVSRTGKRSVVKYEGRNISFKKKSGEVVHVLPSVLQKDYDNLADMEDFSEGAILYHIRKRFLEKKTIYTYVGNVVVAINPYANLPIYGRDYIQQYVNYVMDNPNWDMEPHVYGVTAKTFMELCATGKNQSVLISGESGAGKTETTKKVLSFIAALVPTRSASTSEASIEEKIMNSNPVLESFGNAKTVMNNNSSRFGKLMEVGLDGPRGRRLPRLDEWRIHGAQIYNYILEKSRVTSQSGSERNFHVFYMLLQGLTITDLKRMGLGPGGVASMKSFHYLQQNSEEDYLIEGRDEQGEFNEMMKAFGILGVDKNTVNKLLNLLGAILHLGNILFVPDGASRAAKQRGSLGAGSKVKAESVFHLKKAAELLCCDKDILLMALIKLRTKLFERPSTPLEATAARDALAKDLYRRMFDFVVELCNKNIYNGVSRATIAILDIFGFEIFEQNSFEQLCINFANETLQGHFNKVVMAGEKTLYEDEHVEIDEAAYEQNLSSVDRCLTLIGAKRMGVMSLLDDQVKQGKRASDDSWLRQMNFAFVKPGSRHFNDCYVQDRFSDSRFGIKHFAGTVTYDIDGFVHKNKDRLPEQIVLLMRSSSEPLYCSWFEHDELESSAEAPRGSGRERAASRRVRAASKQGKRNSRMSTNNQRGTFRGNIGTLGYKFKDQLRELHQMLLLTTPHFIRCVKPNGEKLAVNSKEAEDDIFEGQNVLRQLRYSGLFELIKIRKAGYLFRFTHEEFCARYRTLAPSQVPRQNTEGVDWGAMASIILMKADHLYPPDPKAAIPCWVVGMSKVFVRTQLDEAKLETMLRNSLENAVLVIQGWVRNVFNRNLFQRLVSLLGQLNRAVSRMNEHAYQQTRLQCLKYGDILEHVLERADEIMEKNRMFMKEMKVIETALKQAIDGRRMEPLEASLETVRTFRSEHSTVSFVQEEAGWSLLELLQKENLTLEQLRVGCTSSNIAQIETAMMDASHLQLTERSWYKIAEITAELMRDTGSVLPEIVCLAKEKRLKSLGKALNMRLVGMPGVGLDVLGALVLKTNASIDSGKKLEEMAKVCHTRIVESLDARDYTMITDALLFLDDYLPLIRMDRDGSIVEPVVNVETEEDFGFEDREGSAQLVPEIAETYLKEMTNDLFQNRRSAVLMLETLENEAHAYRYLMEAIETGERGVLQDAIEHGKSAGLSEEKHPIMNEAVALLLRVVGEEELRVEMQSALQKDVGAHYKTYDSVLERAEAINFVDNDAFRALKVTRSVLHLQNWFRSTRAQRAARVFHRVNRGLKRAIETQDVELLKKSIVNGHKAYGKETKLVKHARLVYEYVSRREKVVRDVVRGAAVVKNTHAIGYGMDLLGEAVATATAHGITDIPKIQDAQRMYKNLSRGRKGRDMLRKIQDHCVISNVPEADMVAMKDIIRACIQDCNSSPFPLDENVLAKASTDLSIIDDKVQLMKRIDAALLSKNFQMLKQASQQTKLFREKHGLLHTKSMEPKAEEIDMLLKLRHFEADLSVTSPNASPTRGGKGGEAFAAADDVAVLNGQSMREMIESLRSDSALSPTQRQMTLSRIQSLVGGKEKLLQTTREHNYKHGLRTYRLGIRKDKYEERIRAKNLAKGLRVSPIKQQRKQRRGPKQEWGATESQRWAAPKPTAAEMRERGRLNKEKGASEGYSSERRRRAHTEGARFFTEAQRSMVNRAPPENVSEKTNIVNDRRADLSLRYKISQHLLNASVDRQNEILESLARDPSFVKLYQKIGWRSTVGDDSSFDDSATDSSLDAFR